MDRKLTEDEVLEVSRLHADGCTKSAEVRDSDSIKDELRQHQILKLANDVRSHVDKIRQLNGHLDESLDHVKAILEKSRNIRLDRCDYLSLYRILEAKCAEVDRLKSDIDAMNNDRQNDP